MGDISKCEGKNCKSKETCYRYTCEANIHWQSYNNFYTELDKDNLKCDYYDEVTQTKGSDTERDT